MTRGARRPRRADADEQLAQENYHGLNEGFYASRPWSYFNQRLILLALVRHRPETVTAVLREGLPVGPFSLTVPGPGEKDEEGRKDGERFVVAEAAVLLHHVSESLLRLYLAHEDQPPCPWLEVARMRDFRRFRADVEKLAAELDDDERRAKMREVFFGSTAREAHHPAPPREVWETGEANLAAFLADYCRRFLDSSLYNAAKHGLAIHPGETAMQIDDGELISASGPSIDYLDHHFVADEDGVERWQWARTTSWVDLDRHLALIAMAAQFIEGIWRIARWRYTGQQPDYLIYFQRPAYEDLFKPMDESNPIITEKMQVGLLYYRDAPGTAGLRAGPGPSHGR